MATLPETDSARYAVDFNNLSSKRSTLKRHTLSLKTLKGSTRRIRTPHSPTPLVLCITVRKQVGAATSASYSRENESLVSPFYFPSHPASPPLPPSLKRLDPGLHCCLCFSGSHLPWRSLTSQHWHFHSALLSPDGEGPTTVWAGLTKQSPTSKSCPENLLDAPPSHTPSCLLHPFMFLPIREKQDSPVRMSYLPIQSPVDLARKPSPVPLPPEPFLLLPKDSPLPLPFALAILTLPLRPPLSCCVGDSKEGAKGAQRNSISWIEPMGVVHELDVRTRVRGSQECLLHPVSHRNPTSGCSELNSPCMLRYLAYLILTLHLTNCTFKNKNKI